MSDGTAPRTFVVTVRSAPSRVVVEDVRGGRRATAADLGAVGAQIARWLEAGPAEPPPRGRKVSERA